jgi:DNA-binding SARP family transcriptional activator/tetratricopeptide (TPR) repeat protein
MIDFRLLGPVRFVNGNGDPITVQRLQTAVLAALLADAGRLVTAPILIARVWGADPPRSAIGTLRSHVSRLRRLLEENCRAPAPLRSTSGGYLLDVDPARVDLHQFHALTTRARHTSVPRRDQAVLLREAMGLWDGEPLAELSGEWVARTRHAWHQEYRDAATQWAQAELDLGNAAAVIGRLTDLAAAHPLDESVTAVLMRALYASCRQADALLAYDRIRRDLAQELGVDPGPTLRAVYAAILSGVLDAGPGPATTRARVVPALLPPDVTGFVGRRAELAALNRLLPAPQQGTAAVIAALSGMAGVGKTALAVHWAHQVRDRFPDGQLYLDLRGFAASGTAVPIADAVRRLLYALGASPQSLPPDPDAQMDMYRTEMSYRRILLLLDNARDAEHVRPLLPGSSTVMVLVTSRDRLSGLVATHAVHDLTLGMLPVDDARDLLQRRLGPERIRSEPAAVDAIIEGAARLPLALAIAASRAVTRRHVSLAGLAAELRGTTSRLDALSVDDPAADARATLSWSCRTLTPGAARLFRLLSIHPGPDAGIPAVAGIGGVPAPEAVKLLTELLRAHLVTEPRPDRFAFHDLVHAYADERATADLTAADRTDATARMLDYYLHSAHSADRALNPALEELSLEPLLSRVAAEHPTGSEQALAWLADERPVLCSAVRHAAAHGFDAHAWQLAVVLVNYLDAQGYWHDQSDMAHVAVTVAARIGDRAAEARSRRLLGFTWLRLDRYADADDELVRALDLYGQCGDPQGRAHTYYNLAQVAAAQDRFGDAIAHARRALTLYTAADHTRGHANTLNALGWFLARAGRNASAVTYCQQALTLHRAVDNVRGMANTHDSLGYVHHRLGRRSVAIEHYQQAAVLCRSLGDRYYEANILLHLGDAHRDNDQPTLAGHTWRQSLAILDEIGHPHAAAIRRRLRGADDARSS